MDKTVIKHRRMYKLLFHIAKYTWFKGCGYVKYTDYYEAYLHPLWKCPICKIARVQTIERKVMLIVWFVGRFVRLPYLYYAWVMYTGDMVLKLNKKSCQRAIEIIDGRVNVNDRELYRHPWKKTH